MPRTNRIKKFIKQSPPHAKCVVVSDVIHDRVVMSYHGNKFLWSWNNGLLCPGSSSAVDVHPLAAEALIVEEIMSFIRMEGIISGWKGSGKEKCLRNICKNSVVKKKLKNLCQTHL